MHFSAVLDRLRREPDPWSAERTGRARASAFGRAEEYRLLPPSGQDGSHLSLWLLPGLEVGQWLAPLWRIALPPLAATGLPVGVPLELRFERIGNGEPDAEPADDPGLPDLGLVGFEPRLVGEQSPLIARDPRLVVGQATLVVGQPRLEITGVRHVGHAQSLRREASTGIRRPPRPARGNY